MLVGLEAAPGRSRRCGKVKDVPEPHKIKTCHANYLPYAGDFVLPNLGVRKVMNGAVNYN